MNFRAARNFRATRSSTTIAVAFSILSAVSTFAGGNPQHANPENVIHSVTSHLWQGTEDKETTTQYLCAI